MQGPDASNSCLPPDSPVVISVPPVPTATRGERCVLDGQAGRFNADKAVICYHSGKLIVARNLDGETLLPHTACKLPVLIYRGHHYAVTALKLSPSGYYVASGDERGMLRVWAFDHEEHLCKYETAGLTGALRDFAWDAESKRLALVGERSDPRSESCKVIQWDTGVTCGQLSAHLTGRVASTAFKPNRPYRIITAGKDDHSCYFHKGPPFQKVATADSVPAEQAHTKGSVNCIRYNSKGTLVVSVGSDRAICTYHGATMALLDTLEDVHAVTIYACAWSGDDSQVMTASGDGTCKLFSVDAVSGKLAELHTWKVAQAQIKGCEAFEKVPVGGTQLGCTFVKGNIPVSVGLNGQLCMLPAADSDAASDMAAIKISTGHYAAVAGVAVDHANGVFYTGDTDGILCKWDLATCECLHRLEPAEGNNEDLMYVVHGGAISGLAIASGGTADGSSASLLSVGWDDKMYITDKEGGVGLNPVSLGAQPSAISTGTNLGVIATTEGILLVVDNKISDMTQVSYAAKCVCVSKDDKTVYVGGDDCKIHVYDVTDGGSSLSEKKVIDAHLKQVHAVALSNDGTKLASGDTRDVCVWDLADDYKAIVARGRWCFHVQRITCLSWSPDDAMIISGGADDSIYLWNIEKKTTRIHYPFAHRGGLTQVHFLPKETGLQFLSVGVDSVVNKWDVTKDVADKFS
jgi:WD40 repeat protein